MATAHTMLRRSRFFSLYIVMYDAIATVRFGQDHIITRRKGKPSREQRYSACMSIRLSDAGVSISTCQDSCRVPAAIVLVYLYLLFTGRQHSSAWDRDADRLSVCHTLALSEMTQARITNSSSTDNQGL